MTIAAFDSVAGDYDLEFTRSPLGRDLRAIVWDRLATHFAPGHRILELNCGTGEDAVWMAQRGIRVLATDISTEMLELAAHKAEAGGVARLVEIRPLDLARPESLLPGLPFDGALSNFGGLNCVKDLKPLASMLGERVAPGGRLILVLMSRYCAWEIVWHFLHLRPDAALRRLRPNGVEAGLGRESLRVYYPTIGSIRHIFAPWFVLRRTMGLGVFLPPTYLAPRVVERPGLYRVLRRLERSLAPCLPFGGLGDHTILEFERTGETFRRGQ